MRTEWTDDSLDNVGMADLRDESDRQVKKWGVQTHTLFEWITYTVEELGELAEAVSEYTYRGAPIERIIKEAQEAATLAAKIMSMARGEWKREQEAGK